VRKCPYCDFNSHEAKGELPEQEYLDAVRLDLEQSLPLIWGRKIHTVFIGGGTPSLMSAGPGPFAVGRAHAAAAGNQRRDHDGGQSRHLRDRKIPPLPRQRREPPVDRHPEFQREHLKSLGRIHDEREALRAVEIAHSTFDNFNLDLMYALPSQTLAQAEHDLKTALSFAPPHLSLYHLTMEPNTVFAKYPPALPDDDTSADMQDMIAETMSAAGYDHYEVSAYAQPGRQARHNLNYWNFGDYLGIGAGAHSKISFPHRILRQARFKQPASFMEAAKRGNPVQEEHEIARADMGFEFMLNTLRLTGGFDPNLFGERTGMSITAISKALDAAEAKGLLYRDFKLIRPTELGQRFLNDCRRCFWPPPSTRYSVTWFCRRSKLACTAACCAANSERWASSRSR
jgi:coproporphyrinogen III oxidase-like Fe-S oxidoreductase